MILKNGHIMMGRQKLCMLHTQSIFPPKQKILYIHDIVLPNIHMQILLTEYSSLTQIPQLNKCPNPSTILSELTIEGMLTNDM